ncbi:hypothetical protein [Alteriqipengyuania lutimaris]|uniref:hypothetical protein n=1 Tax=Alteriqipengyuania lutimaris TaxID=1538146 RepID=UPI001CFD5ABF|nr:hypothetical protein [Alteriqipengyuania lutimaris]
MDQNRFVPLADMSASDIRNVTAPGLMLSIRERQPHVLILDWDGAKYALKLDGPDAFGFFPVSAKTPHDGLYVPNVEILVDLDSRGIGRGRDEDKGVLILEEGQLFVLGKQVGDGWSDPRPVPLWTKVAGGSEGARVAFDRWAIGLQEGDDYRILWSYEFKPKAD